jgi:hypothetical protein
MGRRFITILFSILFLLVATTVNASIVSWNCDDDGDGAIVMGAPTWVDNGGGDYTLSMSGAQYWAPGHVAGSFTTDTPGDPTVRIIEDVQNDTGFAWSDYHIAIGMTQTFSFVSSGLLAPIGWTAVVTAPSYPQTMPNGGTGWVGMIDYYQSAGSVVAIGDVGTFGFKVSFDGSIQYCTQQYPTPEPTTILLLGLGAMSVIRRRR